MFAPLFAEKKPVYFWAAFVLLCIMPPLLVVSRALADISTCMIGALFLIHTVYHKEWGWLKRRDMQCLALLWVILIISAALNQPDASLKTALTWGRFALLYAAMRYWLLLTPQAMHCIAISGFVTCTLLAIDTWWQYIHGISLSGRAAIDFTRIGPVGEFKRLTGAMAHSNVGNLLLKISLPCAGWWLMRAWARKQWVICAYITLTMVSIFMLIPLTGERSITLLMGMAIVLMAGLFILHQKKWWIAAPLILAAGLLVFWFAQQPPVIARYQQFMFDVSDFSASVYGQLFLASWHIWQEYPLFGAGPKAFYAVCLQLYGEPIIYAQKVLNYCDVHSHNIYLQWLSETGLAGFIIFIAFTGVILAQAWRSYAQTMCLIPLVSIITGTTTLIVLFFPVIVTQSMLSNWSGMLFWFTLALACRVLSPAKDHEV